MALSSPSSLVLSELDAAQKERVAFLFADAICGTDSNAYRYEVDASGKITGRIPIQPKPARISKIARAELVGLPIPHTPSDDEIARIHEAWAQLGEMIYHKLEAKAHEKLDPENTRQGASLAHLDGALISARADRALSTLPPATD